MAPLDIYDCFWQTVRGVRIAEKYQMPVIILTDQALAYRERIRAAVPEGVAFKPLMPLYLTDNTPAEEIEAAARKARARRFHELSKEVRSIERQIAKHEDRKADFEAQRAEQPADDHPQRLSRTRSVLDNH